MQISKFKLKISRIFIFLGVSLLAMTACDKELAEIDQNKVFRKISAQEQELIKSTNQLSLDLLKAEYTKNDAKNVFFSPVSVGMALGMIYNGVGEVEKSEIQHVMNLELLVEKDLNKSYNELLNFFHIANEQFNISYANSLWFPLEVKINESFRTKAVEYINSWGSMKTNGNFEQLIKIAPTNTEDIFLINAFGLNTQWKQANDLYRSKSQFYLGNGAIQQVRTINWKGVDIRLSEQDDYSYFEIPFENDLVLLSVIQPQTANALSTVIDDLSLDDLANLRSSAFELKADVSLPEINFNTEGSIKDALSDIGLSNLFLTSTNLSPSFGDGNRRLTDISHLSKIKTNSRALAHHETATLGNQQLMAVNVDRPFLYFVQDKHTNTVLFAGYYSNPFERK